MICVVKCVKNGGFPPFFLWFCAPPPGRVLFWRRVVIGGVGGGTVRFWWAGAYFRCFILCRDDKNDGAVRYTANIVQIIKSLSMWRRLRDDFSPVLVV